MSSRARVDGVGVRSPDSSMFSSSSEEDAEDELALVETADSDEVDDIEASAVKDRSASDAARECTSWSQSQRRCMPLPVLDTPAVMRSWSECTFTAFSTSLFRFAALRVKYIVSSAELVEYPPSVQRQTWLTHFDRQTGSERSYSQVKSSVQLLDKDNLVR